MVKTRTVVQTRTHAQKYFQKVSKSGGGEDSENENDATEESAVKAVPFLNDRTATVSNKSSSPSKVSNESPTSNFSKGSKGMEAMCDGYIVKSPARDDVTASQVKQNPYGYHAYTVPSSGYPTIGGDAHENDPYAPLWSGKRKHFELTSAEVLEGQPYPSKISDGSNNWNWSSSTHPYPGTGREQVRIGRSENHDNSNPNSNSSSSNGAFPSSLSSDYLMDMEGEGAQVLSMMKEMNETNLSMPNDQLHHTHTSQKINPSQTGRSKGPNSAPSSLTIFNPESINHYAGGGGGGCSDNQDAPDTPWESEVRALEARIAFLPRATSVGESENSDAPHLQKFSTPSEQRDFMKRVTTLLDRGFRGVAALEALLCAAASTVATNVLDDSDGENSKLKEGNGSGKKDFIIV